MPLNDNLKLPIPTNMLGGIGPFDFSDEADPAAIPMTIKFDNGTPETIMIDLTVDVIDIAAVTVTELRNRINAENPMDIIASVNANGRIKLAYDGSDPPDYIQVYNIAAIIAMFGQGYGLRFRKIDTFKSLGETPITKDEETITTTDAEGRDTSLITDGYRKGVTVGLVDSANDWDLRAVLEGGHYNDGVDGNPIQYDVPTSEDTKCYFYLEAFFKIYTRGDNKVGDLVGYEKMLVRTCKASVGDKSHEAGWSDDNFSITATTYKDENDDLFPDTSYYELTREAYDALDLYNV